MRVTRRFQPLLALLLLSVAISGCDLIGDVIQFGFWTIVILIGVIVLLIWGLRASMRSRRRDGNPPPPQP